MKQWMDDTLQIEKLQCYIWKQIYKRIHISSCSVVAGNIIQYSVSNDNKNMRYSSYE